MKTLKLEFVEFIPEILDEGILYISMKYKAARHRCACGCGAIIITPISPQHWNLKYDGKGVTLSPSIGNWNFPCQSHYWIVKNEIRWARTWTIGEIAAYKGNIQLAAELPTVKSARPHKKSYRFMYLVRKH